MPHTLHGIYTGHECKFTNNNSKKQAQRIKMCAHEKRQFSAQHCLFEVYFTGEEK